MPAAYKDTEVERQVRQEYDRLASVYDRRWEHYHVRVLRVLEQWAALPAHSRVLDVGCGTGLYAKQVLEGNPGQCITGVDLSFGMLAVAQRRCAGAANVTFQAASAVRLPFRDASFDVVVSASALHYFSEPLVALKEMQRVVTAEGFIVLLDWCRDYVACKVLDAVLGWRDPAYYRTYTEVELHELLGAAGFTLIRGGTQRCGLLWGLMVAVAAPARRV